MPTSCSTICKFIITCNIARITGGLSETTAANLGGRGIPLEFEPKSARDGENGEKGEKERGRRWEEENFCRRKYLPNNPHLWGRTISSAVQSEINISPTHRSGE
jgi:hypothetical protein